MSHQRIFTLLFAFLLGLKPYSAQSLPELLWASKHPFSALKVKRITANCQLLYDSCRLLKKTDNFYNGGNDDALRHIFFMAAYSQKIKSKKLISLGRAHEKGNYRHWQKSGKEDGELADSLSTVMDLFNNNIGVQLGKQKPSVPLEQLLQLALMEVYDGKGIMIKRNKTGQYVSCDGKKIEIKSSPKTWYVPKCLVPTNYVAND